MGQENFYDMNEYPEISNYKYSYDKLKFIKAYFEGNEGYDKWSKIDIKLFSLSPLTTLTVVNTIPIRSSPR